jgi:hypothetical protein
MKIGPSIRRASPLPLGVLRELCGEIPLSLTVLESTLTRTDESVSKRTTLTYSESTLTTNKTPRTKQRTSTPVESTLTSFPPISHLESTLAKKGGGG